ncbi:hypothetical protein [Kosakonia cowanii]
MCGQGGAGLTGAAGNRQFERLPGRLRESLTLTSAAMMKTLNTNMTGLNISQAVTLLAP